MDAIKDISRDLFGNEISEPVLIDRDTLAAALGECFQSVTLSGVVSMLTDRYSETIEYSRLLRGERACQKTSLLFNPHRLDTKTKSSKASIYSAMQDPGFLSGLARAALFKHGKCSELLYQTLQLGVNGIQYVNEFPPHVAREAVAKYGNGPSTRVLDPCAGWGGRLLGVSAACDSYMAFEPSTATHSGLLELADFVSVFRPRFRPSVLNQCFEDADLVGCEFDMAITSPPYYDTEEYSDEDTNSLNRYNSFDSWRDGFYVPMIAKTMSALRPGGVFILNIGSRVYPLSAILMDTFSSRHTITKSSLSLSGVGGLGKSGEGESFYVIKKDSSPLDIH